MYRAKRFPFILSMLFLSACSEASTRGPEGSGTGEGNAVCGSSQKEHHGEGTFYDADGSGNCSFEKTSDVRVAAMNGADYAGSAACGACVRAKGPSGEVTVRIVDRCPNCKPGDIDFGKAAFAEIADLSLGRIAIDWSYVACAIEAPIRYHFKEGSNAGWTAVQIRDARYAIETLEVQQDGGFVPLNRVEYNYFVAESGMGAGPYTFRVTDVNGHVLTDEGIPLLAGGDAPGEKQFPACTE